MKKRPEPKTPQDVKIAVYAICKDEIKFVDKWVENIYAEGNGADAVYVLDTGSTDGTVEEFQRICAELQIPDGWLHIETKKYKDWRFDTARNDNLCMIDNTKFDVLYCIDLDEMVIPDFWTDLRQVVYEHPNFERIYYKYAWSHDNETGEPKWYFWYSKIHKPGWLWKYPVHEFLYCDNLKEFGYSGTYNMDENKVYLHHYPDPTKSRSNYLPLLKQRAEEYKDDMYGLFYLAREYAMCGDVENQIKEATGLYVRLLKGDPTPEELAARDDMYMLPSTCIQIADGYRNMQMIDDAILWYKKAIKHDPTSREAYIKLAQTYSHTKDHLEGFTVLRNMDEKSKYVQDWRMQTWCWRDWCRLSIEGNIFCWMGKYDTAIQYYRAALNDIHTEDDKRDAAMQGFYEDLMFVTTKYQQNLQPKGGTNE